MKNEVLSILKSSEVSMDATSIMNVINPDYKSEDLIELIKVLNELESDALVYKRKDLKYMPIERSKYLKGKLEITKNGSGFLLQDKEDIYINKRKLNGAEDGDIVLCEIINSKKLEGRVVRIVERNLGGSLAEIIMTNNVPYIKLLNSSKKHNIVLVNYQDLQLVDGQIVKLKIEKEDKNYIYATVEYIVGHKNAPDIDILKIVAEFDIPVNFSEEALEEVKFIPNRVLDSEIKGRVDLRSKEIFTIDGIDTKDIDDAISLDVLENGNYKLGVHIADVSHYVKEGMNLKEDAFLRGNSVYLADRVIPMLPVELSNGICSLNENVDRLAMSCEMEIDKNGNVVNKKIFESIINSKKKMNYKSVNKIFEGEDVEGYEPFKDTLFKMLELSKILKKNKEQRGEIDFISTELKLIVDENGKVTEIQKRHQGIGEELIENFMVVTNESVSRTMSEHNVPSIYRVHGMPSEKKLREFLQFASILGHNLHGKINYNNVSPKDIQNILKQLEDAEEYEILNKKLLRSMQKAVYDVVNIGHFGIASKDYTHFTSPIRRFSDLQLHYLIKELLFKKNTHHSFIDGLKRNLPFITEHVSNTERTAEDCEYEVDDMKVAEYMESHIGEIYNATIDGTLKNGFFVETEEGISGLVSLESLNGNYTYKEELMSYTAKGKSEAYRIGDKIKVKCVRASKEERVVDFEVVTDGNN